MVRFELLIVAVLTGSAVLLAVAVARAASVDLGGDWQVPLTLVGAAVVIELVPSFTYATRSAHDGVLHLLAGTCVLAAGSWRLGERGRRAVPVIAAIGYLAGAVWIIHADPAPRIDVWVILQQASDGLAHGANAYSSTWTGSPGEKDAFTYLPWTLVLLAPGRWLFGDVRWALMAWTIASSALVLALGRWRGRGACAAAALLLLMPGTTTQVEQSWTEPLLLALLAAWAVLVSRGHAWWAVLPLALALASKQHMALLLPLLAVWPVFGWRRSLASGGGAAVLVAPWFIASPADMWHDTVTLLVGFHPILFANTLYLASIHELGSAPPFWLTGLIAAATLASAVIAVRRRQPGLGEVLRWCALVLFVVNLVNKQAFYNQYWLVAALVLLSVAAPRASLPGEVGEVAQPDAGEGRLGEAQDRPEGRRGRSIR